MPSVHEIKTGQPAPKRPRAMQCHIRDKLAHVVGVGDLWWKSNDPQVIGVLALAVRRDIPLFFDSLGEAHAILELWRNDSLRFADSYVVPVLLHEEGREGFHSLRGRAFP